jgi:hypothetical protein
VLGWFCLAVSIGKCYEPVKAPLARFPSGSLSIAKSPKKHADEEN